MMALTLSTTDLALIRDEVGDDPPTTDLRKSFLVLQHWMLVALRVLKRRRAALLQGGDVSQVTIPGAIAVTVSKGDLAELTALIDALQARYDAETGGGEGATAGRLGRRLPR
jgi:hypothetical protein